MARGFRIGYGAPGTFSVNAETGAYTWVGRDADLVYSESGGAGNLGQVGNYANLDLAAHPIYTIDVTHDDYGIMRTQGSDTGTGTDTLITSGWPLGGGAYVRFTPPTTAGFERGIQVNNLWNDATLQIQELNFRFEWRANSTFCSMIPTGPKFIIVHTTRVFPTGNPGAVDRNERPVIFLRPCDTADNSSHNRANTVVLGPGQGTTAGYGPLPYDDDYQENGGTLNGWPNGPLSWYYKNTADSGTTFQGVNLCPVDEVVTMEMRMISTTSVEYPRGLIAFRIYRENGQVAEMGIPWDFDTTVPFGQYFYEIQQFGNGQWNTLPGSAVQWMDVGTYITVARDLGGWLGRRNAA